MFEYRVHEVKKKKFIHSRMTTEDLQIAINEWAQYGWELDKIVSGETFHFITGGKDVFLLIFKRRIGADENGQGAPPPLA